MLKVGLTGSIGSGKTTVSKVFELQDVPVYRADEKGRFFLDTEEVVKKVTGVFGEKVLKNSGKIDRRKLASIVFDSPQALEKLNAIIHPKVREDYEIWHKRQQNCHYTLQEAAILFETGHYRFFDAIIVVAAPQNERILRVCKRDGVNPEEVEKRMKNQMEQDEKIKRADFVIYNHDPHMVLPRVIEIHERLIKQALNRD